MEVITEGTQKRGINECRRTNAHSSAVVDCRWIVSGHLRERSMIVNR